MEALLEFDGVGDGLAPRLQANDTANSAKNQKRKDF
jgi:hypothetical protein